MEEIIGKNGTLPGAVHKVPGAVQVALLLVVGDKQRIVNAVMIAQGSGPLAGAIGILAVPQVVNVIVLQYIIDVTDDAPVHQVPRMHDGGAGAEKHGGTHHVVVLPHPDNIVVRDIRVRERIHCQEGAVRHHKFLRYGILRACEQHEGAQKGYHFFHNSKIGHFFQSSTRMDIYPPFLDDFYNNRSDKIRKFVN